jgi:intracellular septation protein
MSPVPSWLKPVVDFGPLAAFLVAFELKGLPVATAALMAASLVAVVLSLVLTRKLPVITFVTAAVVGVFGGLSLWLHDDTFIKLKPTIIYGLLAVVLGGGVLIGKPVLKLVLGEALVLDDVGIRALSIRFALFFLVMAATNEAVRHLLSTEMWVLWKVPGSLILTFLFTLSQMRLIARHQVAEQKDGSL